MGVFLIATFLMSTTCKICQELLTEGLLIIFSMDKKHRSKNESTRTSLTCQSFHNFFQLGFSVFCEIIEDCKWKTNEN